MTRVVDPAGEYSIPYYFAAPYLDGVYLAVNAVPDAYLVYDAHDCGYYKAEKIAGGHDLFSDLLRWDQAHRVVRTNVEMHDYVMGSEDKLSKKLRQVIERHEPGIVFIARSNPIVTCGHDATAVLRDLGKKSKIPLVLIPDHNLEKDYVTGYLDALEGLTSKLTLRKGRARQKSVVLTGYVFDRNEGDHRGNVQELKRLLGGIGAKVKTVLLDGDTFASQRKLERPELVIDLAGGWKGAESLARSCSAECLSTDLPVGIEGTARWIRLVGRALGLEEPAEAFIEREVSGLARTLEWILPRFFSGKSVMVFADRLLLPPLGGFLEELGFLITGCGCTTADLQTEWPQVPAYLPQLEQHLAAARGSGRLDLIVGNSIIRQASRRLAAPFVELGYPSNSRHAIHPAPFLGFSGVKVLVERLINALIRQGVPGCG